MLVRLLCLIIGYAFGLVQTAYIIGRLHGIDIREHGSGNAGTTNALRVLGKKAALITLVIDICKGALAVLMGMKLGSYQIGTVCALAVFCGHIWPCLYRFKGGKGVATSFGAILAVNWQVALLELAVVAVGLGLSRRMSVGSLLGAVAFPAICCILEPEFIWIGCIMAVIVVIKHRANIQRLIKGEEPKMF